MEIRQKLPLEQQFELRVFEDQVQNLSQEEARTLLVQLREAMLYQATTFQELLKNSWEIGKDTDVTFS